MPSAKRPTPRPTVKTPVKGSLPPEPPRETEESSRLARTSRAKAYLSAERERERELEKKGYCF